MKIVTSCSEMRGQAPAARRGGAVIGFVPTMGALHEGHLSLVGAARRHCDYVVVSIYVNPAQFGPAEDLDKYPRRFEEDCGLAEKAGCDCLFAPLSNDMYPAGYSTYISVENITASLCGRSRPGHFRGVATIVLKLFNIVSPDVAVFGAKDAQQVIVVKRMVEDLNLPVRIIAAPTVREADGLAMSSRNAYLSPRERAEAPRVYGSLIEAEKMYGGGERDARLIKDRVMSVLEGARLIKPEYVEIADTVLVTPVALIDRPVLLAVACRTAETGTRLIDNIVLGGGL